MRKPIKIGEAVYSSKKDALSYYKEMLNSYQFEQSLTDKDYNSILDLLDYSFHKQLDKIENLESQTTQDNISLGSDALDSVSIVDVRISRVQFNTKCFEVFYSDHTSEYISYLMIINDHKYTDEKLFYIACRNAISKDVTRVKQEYFKKNAVGGFVKCQETGVLSEWADLVVDHRQPNTFSIIVDRFKEVNHIITSALDYTSAGNNMIIFKDDNMSQKFIRYHSEKANLRVVRKDCNASRSNLARVKKSSRDLGRDNNQLSLF